MRHVLFFSAFVFGAATVAADARGQDSSKVYFEFQVTKPVRQDTSVKVAPRYPPELKAAGVEGEVLIQFVVDTLGAPDVNSIKVLRSSHVMFTTAVTTAIPNMRFVPAGLNGRKVKQLVQQPFVFAIQRKEGDPPRPPQNVPDVIPPFSSRDTAAMRMFANSQLTPAPHAGTVNGWMLAQRITIDSGNGSSTVTMDMTVQGAAGRSRIEIANSRAAPTGTIVMLVDSATQRMSMVMPGMKSVIVQGLDKIGPLAIKMQAFSNSTVTTDLGPDAPIAGVATRHYRLEGTSGVRMTLGERTCTTEESVHGEVWTTTDPVLKETMASVQQQMKRMASSFASLIPDPEGTHAPPGVPMRGKYARTSTGKNGTAVVISMTSEVTAFKMGPVDVSLLEPPEGYRLQDMTAFTSSMRTDSLRRAVAEKAYSNMVDSVAFGMKWTCIPRKNP